MPGNSYESTRQQEYLDTGIKEVNNIGGPLITREDFIPIPTWWQGIISRFCNWGNLALLGFLLVVITLFVGIHRMGVQNEKDTAAYYKKIAKQNMEAVTQRTKDVAIIVKAEHEQAPEIESLMNSIFKEAGGYDDITDRDILVARLPATSQAVDEIRPRLKGVTWTRLAPYGVGYVFVVAYEFVPNKDKIAGDKVICTVNKHRGLKQVDVCQYSEERRPIGAEE